MAPKVLVGLNAVAALIIATFQEYHAYWPHDAVGYLLSGVSVFEKDCPLILSRANIWSLLAGLLAKIHPFFVRVFGLILFFCSAYMLYSLIRRKDEDLAKTFLVVVTLPSYVVWISAAGLSEPLAYLFFVASFTCWIKHIESRNEEYAILSAFFAALLFVVRPPLAIAWAVPGAYILTNNKRLFAKAFLVFLATVFVSGFLSLAIFGTFLPTVEYMIRATSSGHINASPLWCALCGLYPLFVFGVFFAPALLVAYMRYAKDEIPFWLLATLVPYTIAMLLLAPKEPRYYTIFVYPSAYVLARMITDRIKKFPFPLHLALAASSFLFVPGVCVDVEYIPVRTWTLRVPCLVPPFVADVHAKLRFVKYVCSHPAEVEGWWAHIVYFFERFYPSVCAS